MRGYFASHSISNYAVVNTAMIMTYYEIGSIINQRKQWGNKYIERLANDLKEYGKGYSKRTLYYINRFYEEFTRDEIVQHHVAQISWRSIILIMKFSPNLGDKFLGEL